MFDSLFLNLRLTQLKGSKVSMDQTVHEKIDITLLPGLDREAYRSVSVLQKICESHDKITLKLELDYKLKAYEQRTAEKEAGYTDEFIAYMEGQAVGYIGICSFGGPGMPLEVTGMVHPSYRRFDIFTRLHTLALSEFQRRSCTDVLLLCDRVSSAGHAFLDKIGSVYKFCEVEMYLQKDTPIHDVYIHSDILLQKANNADAATIKNIDAAAWNEPGKSPDEEEEIFLPEDEEKRGLTVYLGIKNGVTIGKINLQKSENEVWGIYGFAILPQFRGLGYGRAMLKQSIEKMKTSGAKEIMLQVVPENERALNLYTSCGFKETSVMDYYTLSVKKGDNL